MIPSGLTSRPASTNTHGRQLRGIFQLELTLRLRSITMVEQRDAEVEVEHVIRLHVDRFLVRAASIREIIQARQSDCKVHVG